MFTKLKAFGKVFKNNFYDKSISMYQKVFLNNKPSKINY